MPKTSKKSSAPAKKKQTRIAKKPVVEAPTPAIAAPRRLKLPVYKSFRLQKRIKEPVTTKPIPSSFKLLAGALAILRKNWKPFLGIVVIYGLLNVFLVKGLSAGANLGDLKDILSEAFQGNASQLVTAGLLFTYLIGSSGSNGTDSAGVFQLILILIASLALIWTLRMAYKSNRVRIRDGFYQGMYPLVPFVLVFLVICVQLLPLAIGAFLYNLLSQVSASGVEVMVWATLFFLLALLSVYLLTSSLLALYVVCLPDMQPLQALRAARQLVRNRRWQVLRKMLFLPLALLVLSAIIMIPLIILADAIAVWVFFALSMGFLAVGHSYMYRLYRELL